MALPETEISGRGVQLCGVLILGLLDQELLIRDARGSPRRSRGPPCKDFQETFGTGFVTPLMSPALDRSSRPGTSGEGGGQEVVRVHHKDLPEILTKPRPA